LINSYSKSNIDGDTYMCFTRTSELWHLNFWMGGVTSCPFLKFPTRHPPNREWLRPRVVVARMWSGWTRQWKKSGKYRRRCHGWSDWWLARSHLNESSRRRDDENWPHPTTHVDPPARRPGVRPCQSARNEIDKGLIARRRRAGGRGKWISSDWRCHWWRLLWRPTAPGPPGTPGSGPETTQKASRARTRAAGTTHYRAPPCHSRSHDAWHFN